MYKQRDRNERSINNRDLSFCTKRRGRKYYIPVDKLVVSLSMHIKEIFCQLISVEGWVKVFTIRPRERWQDHSSPNLYCFTIPWNYTLNSQETAENKSQKDCSGRGTMWQPALMFPALMSEKPKCG